MRYTDIAIIGGGFAGSTAAAMLGRAGISAVLIDPHETYPADFRVEKLSGHGQAERFQRTGIAESVLRRATFSSENWIARFGHLLDKAPSRQFNILYNSLPAGRNSFDFPRNRSAPGTRMRARAAPRAGRNAGRRPAAAQAHHRRLRHSRRTEDPPGRSLCERRQPSAGRGAGGRCLRHLLPGRRYRLRQRVHRRRAALQRPYPAMAGVRRDGCGQDRRLLRRPGQAGVR